MNNSERHKALHDFAEAVRKKLAALAAGEPEDQLRAPLEALFARLDPKVTLKGESLLAAHQGKPDYAVLVKNLLSGYIELKAPGVGARPEKFKGHDRKQWERFQALPNILYSDGNEWTVYQAGVRAGHVRFSEDITEQGKKAVSPADAVALGELVTKFLSWEPIVPKNARQLAATLAPLCRLLRHDVTDALQHSEAFVTVARDWRELLFPEATDAQFADAYAQTVTYGLLLSRAEGASPLDITKAARALRARHTLLARALEILTDEQLETEIATSLRLLQRVIDRVDPKALTGAEDPWLYFYEDFLSEYDPKLRKDAGVYYTPVEVVLAQVRLVDELLSKRIGRSLGFAADDVITLDPGVGTGTYLIGAIDHALDRVKSEEGEGAVPGRASVLARNLHGFEIMVGPYAVAELRVSQSLARYSATLPVEGPGVYLTDTLESPTSAPKAPPLFLAPLAKEHERARRVKDSVPVLVVLGNPPYDRHEASKTTGGWVRWGDKGETPILEAFLKSVRDSGQGLHLKNLYNLYVYFWRWALWKVFEHTTAQGPGVVSFISASSYLDGPAFVGMREHLRRVADDIWIIDLGGEQRGTRKSENVFAIQTPVAIAIVARYGKPTLDRPARALYTRLEGTRDAKLQTLKVIRSFADLTWEECPSTWSAALRPVTSGAYFDWPRLTDLFPWQHSGAQFKRTWPLAPLKETLKKRWAALIAAPSSARAGLFRETRDRKVTARYPHLEAGRPKLDPIAKLTPTDSSVTIQRYAYRSLDRQWAIADSRVADFIREVFWRVHSPRQVYLTSLLTGVIGGGPALVACAEVPDLHHYRGSFGGKDVIPLWRDRAGSEPNVIPGLLDQLKDVYGAVVTAEELFAYCYAVMAHPAYSSRFAAQLEHRQPRVPITRRAELFQDAVKIGRRLLWVHTYGTRFVPKGKQLGEIPPGKARWQKPISSNPERYPARYAYDSARKVLSIGDGEVSPIDEPIWEFEVSGLRVVASWLDYRMRDPRGKHSSALEEIQPERWPASYSSELLALLAVIETTLAAYPSQANLLERIVTDAMLTSTELPQIPADSRRPPDVVSGDQPELL